MKVVATTGFTVFNSDFIRVDLAADFLCLVLVIDCIY